MEIKTILLSTLLCFGVTAWGQTPVTTSDMDAEKKKEINELKKNGEAYYSDTYHVLKPEDADLVEIQQRSKDMLKAHVVEIFYKRMGMSKDDVKEIWAVLDKNCQNIVVKKGDLFRIFTYVMKNVLNPDAVEETVSGGDVETPDSNHVISTSDSALQPEVKADTVIVSEPSVPQPMPQPENKIDSVTTVLPESISEPQSKLKPEAVEIVVSDSITSQQISQSEVKDSIATITPAPVPEPKPEPAPIPEIEIPILCQNLIAKGTFDKVYRYLEQEKTYQRLMFGAAKVMQRPEKCYIVLTDRTSGEIVAVLDKGKSERMNFITKKMDHFRNYQGRNYKAIFVQEY